MIFLPCLKFLGNSQFTADSTKNFDRRKFSLKSIVGFKILAISILLLPFFAQSNTNVGASCAPVGVYSSGYCSGSSENANGSSQAAASAHADLGVLKASATATAITFRVGDVYGGAASATASATFSDSLIITSLGLSGQRGTTSILAFLRQTGALVIWPTPLATAGAYARLYVTTPSTTTATYRIINYVLSANNSSTTYVAYNDGKAVSFDTPIEDAFSFTFGQPFNFTFNLQVGASAQRDGIATLEAGQSVYWAGLGAVYHMGNEVQNYSIASLSGTDYSTSFVPVPEVSTQLLLLVGVLSLFAIRHMRSRCL